MKRWNLKLDFDKAQRRFAAKHVMNLGYGSLAALAFSQVLTDRVNYLLIVLGMLIYAGGWYASLKLKRETA